MFRVFSKIPFLHSAGRKLFFTQANKLNHNNKHNVYSKYADFLSNNVSISYDTLLFSKYVKIHKIKNYNFIFYGILHGQVNGKSCSGTDCTELLKRVNPDYVLLELCEYRLNKIFHILSKKEKTYKYLQNNYTQFTYLPRIHNGFLQNEMIPIVEECIKNKLKLFLFDRNINTIKNRLDSKLLYDTKSYRKFFTYCIESISLRHYPYDEFTKLYKDYLLSYEDVKHNKNAHINTTILSKSSIFVGAVNREYNNSEDNNNKNDGDFSQCCDNEKDKLFHDNSYENADCLKKLNLLHILNNRLKLLSKPTYEVLVEEKCKYIANNIWCFLLNNETHFFQNNTTKNVLVVCSANILEKLAQEFTVTYINLGKRYNGGDNGGYGQPSEELTFENPYSSYNNYVKPHWPLIFIKYYILPYFILYIILNTFYSFCSWIYKSNFQRSATLSHKIVDIEV
ncbi:conserved Plasmodium protein, unknown function [Plasmodium ovale]|uniref:Uncharacterized protein n=2 Tax=Plasmodium ovale TaxID=36330 RepID=A0A1A8X4L2_PLAOA|nr:conserved Plasmodium protein, unknown function [Plasmodium ovale curtisi]SBS98703.1 conserved Plasmodium protein, unknown function [Plasmodium ovale curtisi]SCQ17314.1 conserved Plasmodium protein, unknown function [Plasmodium ovale]